MTALSREPQQEAAPPPWALGFHPVALAVAAVHFAGGFAVLRRGQPCESAYVLFRYGNQLAAGRGMTYYPAGPRAEGASDFAWVVGLAVGRALGVDVALGALVLNTLGAFLAATIFASFLSRPGVRERWYAEAVPFLVLVSCSAAAGYVGLGSMLYGALALWAYWLFVAGGAAHTLMLPHAALLLGLFRPDGVLLGAGFAALGLWRARRQGIAARYLCFAGAAGAVGGVYFLWRWQYFGHALPLSLHLSARGAGPLPGLTGSVDWLFGLGGPPLAVLVTAALLLPPARRARYAAPALGLAPFAGHVAGLGFWLAPGGVAFRPQAPALLPLWLLAAVVLASENQRPARLARIGAVLVLGWMATPAVALLIAVLHESAADTYVERFAVQLGGVVRRGDTLALSEPGASLTGATPGSSIWRDHHLGDRRGAPHGRVSRGGRAEHGHGQRRERRARSRAPRRRDDGRRAGGRPAGHIRGRKGAARRRRDRVPLRSPGRVRRLRRARREGLHHVYGIRKAFVEAAEVERLLIEAQGQAYQPYLSLPRPGVSARADPDIPAAVDYRAAGCLGGSPLTASSPTAW